MHGKLGMPTVTLVNCYGPYVDLPAFYVQLWSKIYTLTPRQIIWGGDFNCTLDTTLDRSHVPQTPQSAAAQFLNGLIGDCEILAIWRIMHTQQREGTFYSHVYKSWS